MSSPGLAEAMAQQARLAKVQARPGAEATSTTTAAAAAGKMAGSPSSPPAVAPHSPNKIKVLAKDKKQDVWEAVVKHTFATDEPTELSVEKGQRVWVREVNSNGWCLCQLQDKKGSGWVPVKYVKRAERWVDNTPTFLSFGRTRSATTLQQLNANAAAAVSELVVVEETVDIPAVTRTRGFTEPPPSSAALAQQSLSSPLLVELDSMTPMASVLEHDDEELESDPEDADDADAQDRSGSKPKKKKGKKKRRRRRVKSGDSGGAVAVGSSRRSRSARAKGKSSKTPSGSHSSAGGGGGSTGATAPNSGGSRRAKSSGRSLPSAGGGRGRRAKLAALHARLTRRMKKGKLGGGKVGGGGSGRADTWHLRSKESKLSFAAVQRRMKQAHRRQLTGPSGSTTKTHRTRTRSRASSGARTPRTPRTPSTPA